MKTRGFSATGETAEFDGAACCARTVTPGIQESKITPKSWRDIPIPSFEPAYVNGICGNTAPIRGPGQVRESRARSEPDGTEPGEHGWVCNVFRTASTILLKYLPIFVGLCKGNGVDSLRSGISYLLRRLDYSPTIHPGDFPWQIQDSASAITK